MLTLMKRVWRRWKRLTHGLIKAQNFVLMSLVYIVAVVPMGLLLRLVRHKVVHPPLPDPDADSYWEPTRRQSLEMKEAQRMF